MKEDTKDYVFISYSHDDNIDEVLEWFRDNQYNVEYDKSLSAGEEWKNTVRHLIKSNNCKGVLAIMSRNSLSSNAVLEEMEIAGNHKQYAAISLDKVSLATLFDSLDEKSKPIGKDILEFFPREKIYVTLDGLKDGSDCKKLEGAFEDWGLKKDASLTRGNVATLDRYTSEISGEKERLSNQQKGYYTFDMEAINSVLESYPQEDAQLTVLDLGCSNGALTTSRFSGSKFANVIGIDYNKSDIEEAEKNCTDNRFKFFCMDLNDPKFKDKLKEKLNSLGIERVDIVFMALTLHHLDHPDEFLKDLYDVFKSGDHIIIRGSDDGGKLCYPNDELLQDFLSRYAKIVSEVNDRQNGRKLYSQLFNAGYEDISIKYQIVDTCGMKGQDKKCMYNIGFAFREERLKEIINRNENNQQIKKEAESLLQALKKFHEGFINGAFWYCNTSYIAIAKVE